ncbi:MAG: class I SAM-dependent methyltransferase [Minisyncoccia bacterium]
MEIKSPVTGSNNVVPEREIPSSYIIERYKKELDMDVSKFFKNIKIVSIYKCLDTGYRFYYPLNISGDDSFYQKLEKFPWYYMDWKWEHEIAYGLVKKNDKVLEIGCARGTFIKKMKENGAVVEGLELNSDAVKECKEKDLSVYPETIEQFSKNKKNYYDTVCSFQVMEHVYDIKNFINSSLSVLKPGGKMVISIPNNDCLIMKSNDATLNMPPHHMGMWNMNSLIKLQYNFNMKLESIYLEPLQKYHLGFANEIAEKVVEKKLNEKLGPFSFILKNMANRLAFLGISSISEHIIGHSIIVVFKKNE